MQGSANDINVDLDGTVDDRLGVGLIEQIHEDLALLDRNAGIGGDGIAVDEAAVGGGDIQQGAVGDDAGVHGHGAVAQTQARRALAALGVIARGLARQHLAVGRGRVGGAVRPGKGRNGRTGPVGLDDVAGGGRIGGDVHHHAVFQLAVHIALAGGDGLLALRAMLQGGGAAGVAEVETGAWGR